MGEKKGILEKYRGTSCKKSLERPTEEEIEQIKKEEEKEEEIENETTDEETERETIEPSNPIQRLITSPIQNVDYKIYECPTKNITRKETKEKKRLKNETLRKKEEEEKIKRKRVIK